MLYENILFHVQEFIMVPHIYKLEKFALGNTKKIARTMPQNWQNQEMVA
jgi:hypothetical protein